MPLALLAAMPPIIAASIEAGSGPILRCIGASRRLATAPMTPGCSEIVQPPSPTRQPRQWSPSITSTESLIAWPDRLVPAARKVSGVLQFVAQREQAHQFVFAFDDDDQLRHEPVEAGVACPRSAAAAGR